MPILSEHQHLAVLSVPGYLTLLTSCPDSTPGSGGQAALDLEPHPSPVPGAQQVLGSRGRLTDSTVPTIKPQWPLLCALGPGPGG